MDNSRSRMKYFTDVVRTQPLPVLIQMDNGQLRGEIHLHPEHRLLDQLNEGAGFLAVTNASWEQDGRRVESSFIAVQRERILFVIPQEEMVEAGGLDAD